MTHTLAQMLHAAESTKTCTPGTCLANCATWWLGRASGEIDAFTDEENTPHADWLAAKDVNRKRPDEMPEVGELAHWRHTPAGSARWHMGLGHPGHIAPVVRVEPNGKVWVHSTDMACENGRGVYRDGSVATVPLADVTEQMGLIFDGYSREIGGVVVVPVPHKHPKPHQRYDAPTKGRMHPTEQ